MRKMIVNLVSKKCDNNDNSSPQLYHLHNSLQTSIVEIPEEYLSHMEWKPVTRKVRTYLVKSFSIFFLCSVSAMYRKFYCVKEKHIMLKLYILGID